MKRPVLFLAGAFLLFPALLLGYRVAVLGYPFFPSVPGETWELQMEATLSRGPSRQGTLWTGLPPTGTGVTVIEEQFFSGPLDFTLYREGSNRVGLWYGAMEETEDARIFYRSVLRLRTPGPLRTPPQRAGPYPARAGREATALAQELVRRWEKLPVPTRLEAVREGARGNWGSPPPSERDRLRWAAVQRDLGTPTSLWLLFRAAGLSVRLAEGLPLAERVHTKAMRFLQVWDGNRWLRYDLESLQQISATAPVLPLARDGARAVQVLDGRLEGLRWTLTKRTPSHWRQHFDRIVRSNLFLDRWSYFHLPAEFQETFRILLLVPIGTLIIGLLRNIAGFPTFGVFMPVLMALAFRSTGLAYGLVIFTGVVALGYFLRRGLDRLRLLLVPRLSVMLTLVIAALGILALVGNRLGLREFMAVGLLPFVILTMVVERFFILVEESGFHAAIRTALGSVAVAVICYGLLHWERLQLAFFLYPELLFAVAGCQVLLGRYTGYRLSELLRFQALRARA
ncbi:MAG: hypothetical protein HYR52_05615 [Candidatus Tectomicrobia bacterium]|nr:hypothetical protein [Candidatus Tectomicrobia bacterium]